MTVCGRRNRAFPAPGEAGGDIEIQGGGELVSIITKTSADYLGLKEGREVYAVIKASNVMIAVD